MKREPVSDKISVARFMSRLQKLTITKCYAPSNVAEQEKKEDFYNYLQGINESETSRDTCMFMLIGYMNAKVGSSNPGR